jgi:hypothetical protein
MGDGDLLEDAKALVKELDIEDMIVWSGFRQDIPNVLSGARKRTKDNTPLSCHGMVLLND